jgi:hypothetical protein
MAVTNLSDENLRSLERIRRIVYLEEGKETGLDEVLARVLEFYRRFVPYN